MIQENILASMLDSEANEIGFNNFSIAMKSKLSEEWGGWHQPWVCSISNLRKMLSDHIDKDDLVDIANIAMMIWNREQGTYFNE